LLRYLNIDCMRAKKTISYNSNVYANTISAMDFNFINMDYITIGNCNICT